MKIKVNPQAQRFWLAMMGDEKGWKPAVGHAIQVGDYQFCAIPVDDGSGINVSEVTTGSHVKTYSLNILDFIFMETKEGAMQLFRHIGEDVRKLIEKQANLDRTLENYQKVTHKELGERPAIEDVDLEEVEG